MLSTMRYVTGGLALLLFVGLHATADPDAVTPDAVTHLPHGAVADAFSRGAPLLETAAYKIHASRRAAPGQAEVHERDTDVIYVLEGNATLVTGGRVVEPQATAAEEIRGTRIEGGQAQRLAPGDVIVVPNGIPHWFREVPGPFVYYVVKVTAS
jgi:glc operon protein GlcG